MKFKKPVDIQLKKIIERIDLNKKRAQLYNRGSKIFGKEDKFIIWLETENETLNGDIPESLLIDYDGIQKVNDELTKIENQK